MFEIRPAQREDIPFWKTLDSHLPESELLLKIGEKRCYIISDGSTPAGVMRYNLFWDLIPFLTLIYMDCAHRGKGLGRKAMAHWEGQMRLLGHKKVMTSTMVDEGAQHFYRKLGYADCGCLVNPFEPLAEAMEMFMAKQL